MVRRHFAAIAVATTLNGMTINRKLWIPAVVTSFLLALGMAGLVWARVPEYLISGHWCTDAEERFARSLAQDPLLTQPPAGIAPVAKSPEVYQPCEAPDNRYYGGAVNGFDLPPTESGLVTVENYYRYLAAANGWLVSKPATGELVGQKVIDGTAVAFHLSQLEHEKYNTAYWLELRYAELGSSRYLLRIEDTF